MRRAARCVLVMFHENESADSILLRDGTWISFVNFWLWGSPPRVPVAIFGSVSQAARVMCRWPEPDLMGIGIVRIGGRWRGCE